MASRRQSANLTLAGEALPLRALLLAGCVFPLAFLVGVGSNRSLARVGGPRHGVTGAVVVGDLAFAFFLVALLVLGLVVYTFWGGGRRRRRKDEPGLVVEQPEMPWWEKPLALVLASLPLAALAAAIVFLVAHAHPQQVTPRLLGPGITPTPTGHPGAGAARHVTGPEVHWWLWLLVAGAAVVLALVAVALRWRRGRGAVAQGEAEVVREVQALIEESLDELEREPDARRAVIRAYAGMERALARRGLGRRPFEAPFEYLARVLSTIRVSRSAGQRLTALFERARFSEHRIDERMKYEAVAALAAVRDELAEQTR